MEKQEGDKVDYLDEIPVKDFSYTNAPNPPKPKKASKLKIVLYSIVAVLVIVILAFVLTSHNSKKKVTVQVNKTSASSNTSIFNPSVKTNLYTSTAYNLSVNVPNNWKVSEDDSKALIINSNVVNIIKVDGSQAKGRVVVSVTPTSIVPAPVSKHDATAVIGSSIINYTQPTSAQLGQSYISFAQYYTTTNPNGLDAIFITGNSGYTINQIIPYTKLLTLNPTIMVYFQSCNDQKCTNPSDLTINKSMWNNSSFNSTIKNILKSFSLS